MVTKRTTFLYKLTPVCLSIFLNFECRCYLWTVWTPFHLLSPVVVWYRVLFSNKTRYSKSYWWVEVNLEKKKGFDLTVLRKKQKNTAGDDGEIEALSKDFVGEYSVIFMHICPETSLSVEATLFFQTMTPSE